MSGVGRREIVDWGRIGRRLRLSGLALFGLALAAWLVVGAVSGRLRLGDLGGYLGLALAGMFVAEVVVVGGSAVSGLLRAGADGARLAGDDVGLLPTPVRRRWRARRSARPVGTGEARRRNGSGP